jgi:hypothetical protein
MKIIITELQFKRVVNNILNEAVPYNIAKEYLKIERSPEAEAKILQVFNNLKSLPNSRQIDKRGWRIAFPFDEDSTESEIDLILKRHNFRIKDYKNNLAIDIKNNQEIKLTKALNIVSKKEPGAKDLIDRYVDIKSKNATNKDENLMIVFSSAKYDLTGMSTGREWRSCMNLIDGQNKSYIGTDIKEGTIICYLTTTSDINLNNPLGRVLIKPHLNMKNPKDVILYAEYKTYGLKIPSPEKFIDIVDDFMEKTQSLSGVYKRLGCLYPDSDRSEIENKETIRTRALQKMDKGEDLNDAEFISLPIKNKKIFIENLNRNEKKLSKLYYTFATQSQKKFYIRKRLSLGRDIEDYEFKLASKDLKYEILEYKIENDWESIYEYEFEFATTEQQDKFIGKAITNGYFDFPKTLVDKLSTEQRLNYINTKFNSIIHKLRYVASSENKFPYYELKYLTGAQKNVYINELIKNNIELEIIELDISTEQQIELYVNKLLEKDEKLDAKILNYMSKTHFTNYITNLYKDGEELSSWLIYLLNRKQKEILIDYFLDNENENDNENYLDEIAQIQVNHKLRDDQVERYLNKVIKNNYKHISMNIFIHQMTQEQKERYIDYWFSTKPYDVPYWVIEYGNLKQMRTYIDLLINLSIFKKFEYVHTRNILIDSGTPEQKYRVIEYFLHHKEIIHYELLEAATEEQKQRYKQYYNN